MLIEILIAVIPIIIAIISLVYAIKQRNVVKKEISKKRYLESAQVNLNKAIQILKSAELPSLPADAYGFAEAEEKFEDEFFNANELVNNILRASFKLKKRKLTLSVSYKLIDMGEYDKPYSKRETREYTDFSQLSSKWMSELFQSNRSILLESDTSIPDFQPLWWNEISFNAFEWSLKKIFEAKNLLLKFEEVYEAVSPEIVTRIDKIFEDGVQEIFKVISNPPKIEFDLDKLQDPLEMSLYLFETLLNYSYISQVICKEVQEVLSSLTLARKELFLKIS